MPAGRSGTPATKGRADAQRGLNAHLYECSICGSNHREESDRRPLALCPECAAKVAWATGADLAARYRSHEEFARTSGLAEEAEGYRQRVAALGEE